MRPKYYKIPIDPSELFRKSRNKPKLYVSLKQSITEHIQLLLMTAHQELRYDHSYGSIISVLDYSTEKQSGMFERLVESSVLKTVEAYEPRLKDVHTRIKYHKEGKVFKRKDSTSFKVYIHIEIKAVIKQLEEKYEHTFKIFFSPLTET
jgi:predicted component of type VI protein secretion system